MRLGRYRLLREIGSGGMASVHLARDEQRAELVALKIIHPHLAREEGFVRMFLDEARLASRISHGHVCKVFDFGEASGRFYIAMDYLSGQSLREVLRRLCKHAPARYPRQLAIYMAHVVAAAAEGLHAAHELHDSRGNALQVVHRDVSPPNLFVGYDGKVRVLDFGIARSADRLQNTATGVIKGKFSYMAPEQLRHLGIDRRVDVWSLGVVLWESLTLQRLFVRDNHADTVMSVLLGRIEPPSWVRPEIPRELDAIVLRALRRDPAERYGSARELAQELRGFVRHSGVRVGAPEIEHFMTRLFTVEHREELALLHQARAGHGWRRQREVSVVTPPLHSVPPPVDDAPGRESSTRLKRGLRHVAADLLRDTAALLFGATPRRGRRA